MAVKIERDTGRGGMRGGRALAAVLAASVLTTLATAPAAAAGPADAPAGASGEKPRLCVSEDFKLIENGRTAAAGTTYIEIAMDRIGGEGEANAPRREPCSLYRRLDVSWADDYEGSTVGAWAEYDGEPGEPFVIEPGGHAIMTLAQPGHGNYDPGVCEPTPVDGVRVRFDLADDGAYLPTGGGDTVCANPEVAVPRYTVEPSGF